MDIADLHCLDQLKRLPDYEKVKTIKFLYNVKF